MTASNSARSRSTSERPSQTAPQRSSRRSYSEDYSEESSEKGTAPAFGDRRAYQIDPANAREALREAALDVEEGADILMVKPALPYLDIIAQLAAEFDLPLAAYQVSGEYAMIKAAAQNGWLDEPRVVMETLIAIRRAGADMILTYFAKDVAGRLK